MKKIKWGVVGLGKIAQKFCQGLLFSDNSELYALCSPSIEKESIFRSQFSFPQFYTTYDDLLNDKAVDVVYIASPNQAHFQQSKQALEAGKHVLCEKPACLLPSELSALQLLASEKNLFFMEALWTIFLPNIQQLKSIIDQQRLGTIQSIDASFGFQAKYDPDHRLFNPSLGGGVIYDIGIYPLLLSLFFLGTPNSLQSKNIYAQTGCDIENTTLLSYLNATAHLHCSFQQELENEAHIVFENGKIRIPAMFHMPQDLHETSNEGHKLVHKVPFSGNGYNYEAEHVAQCIQKGILESPILNHQFSMELAYLIQETMQKTS